MKYAQYISAYLHATKGWKKGAPPANCQNVAAVEYVNGMVERFKSPRKSKPKKSEGA